MVVYTLLAALLGSLALFPNHGPSSIQVLRAATPKPLPKRLPHVQRRAYAIFVLQGTHFRLLRVVPLKIIPRPVLPRPS